MTLNDLRLDKASHQSYCYKAFLETLFTFDRSVKNSFLKPSLWVEDKEDTVNVVKSTVSDTTSGYVKRRELVKNGKKFHFSMRIHNDLFSLHRYLLPMVSLKLEFSRSRSDFFFIAESKYADKLRVKLSNLKLTLNTVTVAKELEEAHINMLATNPSRRAFYPIVESDV